ncbi:uncharacterized protein [Eurosta solidaginis]|uniref:uncharacterized protein n=1 Tax=Eurosta solidaginis TaxID=178769 RepID=UPI0035307DA3
MHAATMKKINVLWKAGQRAESAEIMQNLLKYRLNRPEANRWYSLFVELQKISTIKENNLQLHRLLNVNNCINDNEFSYIEEYLTCTEPLAKAIDIMQSENNEYYGIVLPYILSVRKKLQRIEEESNFVFCKPLIKSYRRSVEERFGKIFDVNTLQAEKAAIAALSYPRFKNKWLTCLDLPNRVKIVEIFKTCICKRIQDSVPTKNCSLENTFFKFDFDSDSDSDPSVADLGRQSFNTPMAKAELLMVQYFAEESYDLQLLNRYAEIKSIFIKYNTPLPSSAAAEQLFSFATMPNLENNHKLSGDIFEKIIVLKHNLNCQKNV